MFMPYANNKGADHPVHLSSLNQHRCCLIPTLAKSKTSSHLVASVAEQAGLSLTRLQTWKTGFRVTWLFSFKTWQENETSAFLLFDHTKF